MTFIYGLSRSDSPLLEVRYVGKAKDPSKRLRDHLSEARRGDRTHKGCWIRASLRDGAAIVCDVLACAMDEYWADELERAIIAYWRCRGRLVNETEGGDGGRGCVQSKETRRKRSLALRGKVRSEETRARMGAAAKRQMSDPARVAAAVARLVEANKGRRLSSEHRRKLSCIHKRMGPPLAAIAASAMAIKGSRLSEERRAALREAHRNCRCPRHQRARNAAARAMRPTGGGR